NTSRTTVIIVVVAVAAIAAILVLSSVYVYSRKNFQKDFSYSKKLGESGFGSVYKGKLSNGQMIAVKRLSKDSSQGDMKFGNEAGAKVNISAGGATPLHITTDNGRLKIINCLLKVGADPNVFDEMVLSQYKLRLQGAIV
ncbi:hypothetical protein S83_047907, partial [Arachis hypogaea]